MSIESLSSNSTTSGVVLTAKNPGAVGPYLLWTSHVEKLLSEGLCAIKKSLRTSRAEPFSAKNLPKLMPRYMLFIKTCLKWEVNRNPHTNIYIFESLSNNHQSLSLKLV